MRYLLVIKVSSNNKTAISSPHYILVPLQSTERIQLIREHVLINEMFQISTYINTKMFVCVCVCLCIRVFLGHFVTDWETP